MDDTISALSPGYVCTVVVKLVAFFKIPITAAASGSTVQLRFKIPEFFTVNSKPLVLSFVYEKSSPFILLRALNCTAEVLVEPCPDVLSILNSDV